MFTAHLGSGEGLEVVLPGKGNRTILRKLTYTKEHSVGFSACFYLNGIENRGPKSHKTMSACKTK